MIVFSLTRLSFAVIVLLLAPLTACAAPSPSLSLTVMEFGGPNILFAADSVNGKIHAFELDRIPAETDSLDVQPYNLVDFGSSVAELFDVGPLDITYHDLAVHPVTRAAFVTLTIQRDGKSQSAMIMADQSGKMRQIDLSSLEATDVALEETAGDEVTFWRDVPAASLTVTDLQYDDGVLYVAGLSTGEFASTLRQFDYPFDGKGKTSSVEIFHTAHNQNETRAPIRAMTIVDLDGKKTLVAAYTCTPLVTLPIATLKDDTHVVGKTIAELGYGNTPVEVLSLTAYNMQRKPEQFVLVINREMSANLIKLDDLVAAEKAPGITTAFKGLGDTLGVTNTHLPLGGVLEAANQDAQFLLTLRRNIDSGEMQLVSMMKGSYFRLSDFVSEYNFPDYEYSKAQQGTKQFHNMTKPIEGYPELIVE